jgi:hypothetical protein
MTIKSQSDDLKPVSLLTRREVYRLKQIVEENATFAKLLNHFKCGPQEMLATLDAIDRKMRDATDQFNADNGDVPFEIRVTARLRRVCDWDQHYDRLISDYEARAGGR